MSLRCLSIIAGLLAAPALAEAPLSGGARVAPNPLSVLLGLALVVALILAMGWLMRRFGQGAWIPGRSLRPLATLSLGGRERMVLVQVGDEQLLLGVAPGRVNLLVRYERPVLPVSGEDAVGGGFAERLREQLARRGAPPR